MPKAIVTLPVSLTLGLVPIAASAQYFQPSEKCYTSPARDPKPEQTRYADKLFRQYADVARAGGNLKSVFSKVGYYGKAAKIERWSLDGAAISPDGATDPWAKQAVTFKPLGMVLSHSRIGIWAQWQAISNDGKVLGTYDAFLVTHVGGYKLRWLDLYSQRQALQPKATSAFCFYPGDVEEHQQDPKKKLM